MDAIVLTALNGIDKEFVDTHGDYEQYALVYSRIFSTIHKGNNDEGEEKTANDWIDKYICISANGKKVYRKSQARSGIGKTTICLGSRTWKELGLDKSHDKTVFLHPANFIAYYLKNSDKYIKVTAWLGLLGFIFTIISSIVSIVSLFVEFPLVK